MSGGASRELPSTRGATVYDFPVLMTPLAFFMRMGLRDGFPAFELPGVAHHSA
jgi:hypothetical protein